MHYLEARLGQIPLQLPLNPGRSVVGRDPACDLNLEHKSISRRHFALTVEGNTVRIEDLGSRNGVWLDNRRVQDEEIALDQWFVAGSVLMTVREAVTLTTEAQETSPESDARALADASTPADPLAGRVLSADDASITDAGIRVLVELARECRQPNTAVETLLRFIAETCDAPGAAIVQQAAEGWLLRAAHGAELDKGLESVVEELRDNRRGVVLSGTMPVLAHPLGTSSTPGHPVLLVFPWKHGSTPNPEIEIACSMLSWWVSLDDTGCESSAISGSVGDSVQGHDVEVDPFIAISPASRGIVKETDRLASLMLPVLICGESGTGKELLARRIHRKSERPDGPFVALNCASLPRELLEAELFGIEKGVATGVDKRHGHFFLASKGTLFLDEIGDLPMNLQPKLLRALESKEIMPLGASEPIPVDVRIVAATHKDLRSRSSQTSFREDLYYRLAGAVIHVPALRDRPEDILPLARAFIREASSAQGRGFRGFDLSAARLLLGYPWPGNVRELRHALMRALALAEGPILTAELLPEEIVHSADRDLGDVILGLRKDWKSARTNFARLYFSELIKRHGNNLSEASRRAGMSRSNLYRNLEDLGLRPGQNSAD